MEYDEETPVRYEEIPENEGGQELNESHRGRTNLISRTAFATTFLIFMVLVIRHTRKGE